MRCYPQCVDRICPLLVLASDRRAVCDVFDPEHRCSSRSPAALLDRSQQTQVCLTEAYARCPHFLQNSQSSSGDLGIPAPAADAVLPPTRLVIESESAWRRVRSGSARPDWRAVAAGILLLGVSGGAVASGMVGGVASLLGESMAPAAAPLASSPGPSATPTTAPDPSPRVAVEATPLPTVVPQSSVASQVATPSSSTSRTYLVRPGDSLRLIADRFGTSVAAIQRANGIADQNLIEVGQLLVIP
jgi:FOG: LysM repeat